MTEKLVNNNKELRQFHQIDDDGLRSLDCELNAGGLSDLLNLKQYVSELGELDVCRSLSSNANARSCCDGSTRILARIFEFL